jgi:hypothetical protein
MNQSFGRRFRMRLNDNRRFRRFGMKSLYVGAYCSPVDVALRDNNPIPTRDADDDTFLVGVNRLGLVLWRLTDIETDLLDKGSGHDEEDEHDENHVEHGGQVDLLFVFLLPTAAEWSTHVIPLEPLEDERGLYYRARTGLPRCVGCAVS